MIKLKKIQIENFKGIKSRVEIDLSLSENTIVNILSGPNGFGKTTIFDAIEICLVGQFYRIAMFDNVQKKNANKSKPYYQHKDGEDVILKLWIEKETNENYLIIKHYDDANSPKMVRQGRENIPSDSNNFFKTYLTSDINFFDSNDFSSLPLVTQPEIDQIIYGLDSKIKIESIYYLFNYIQQEDSKYFLRQNEDEKGESLGFLFNIEIEERKRAQLERLKEILDRKNTTLRNEIDFLKISLSENNQSPYFRIFKEKEFDFDSENPFDNVLTSQQKLIDFEEKISSIITLKNNFNIPEFEKSLKYKKITNEVLGNDTLLKCLTIKDIFSTELLDSVLSDNHKIDKGKEFKNKENKNVIEEEYFNLFFDSKNELLEYQQLQESIRSIDIDLGQIGRIISDLNSSRERCMVEFNKLRETDSLKNENNCPLCDSPFTKLEDLVESVLKKTEELSSYSDTKLKLKNDLLKNVELISNQLEINIDLFLGTNLTVTSEIVNLLRIVPNFQLQINETLINYPELLSAESGAIFFTKFPANNSEIDSKKDSLKKYIESNVLARYVYNEQLILNRNLFSEYFNDSSTLFESVTINSLKDKIDFLRNLYNLGINERVQFLSSQEVKLRNLKQEVNAIYEKVYRTIKSHKIEMINKIKIPFYIYSGKVLQSYQQGLGIFIDIHPTGQSNNVRFKTGYYSDHDVVFHLSSGQMSVVALAFCLSLNKVYSTNQNFKFLAIDDPIQTMDDLNIHTFIELIRNEFSDYQIIMSTHDDFTSRYMKYKFEKFEMNSNIQNVQQLVFEQSFK